MRNSGMSSREDYVFFGYDIYNCFPPAQEEEIRELEAKVGASLPSDYRRFLATFNGGTLADAVDVPKLSDPPNATNWPKAFFAIGEGVRTAPESDLVKILDRCTWHPPWFLPIGTSYLGDTIGLSLKKKSFGVIYVFDYRMHDQDVPAEECAFLVADGFDAYFEGSSLYHSDSAPNPLPGFRAVDEADFETFQKLVPTKEEANRRWDDRSYLFRSLNHPRFVRHLLTVGADPHVLLDGCCPLNGCEVVETVELLLRHGANPNSLTPEGIPPLLQAQRYRIHELLLAAGADVNFMTPRGQCLDVGTKRPGLRDLWRRHGLDPERLCNRLCGLMADPDSPWESVEDDEETLTVGEHNLIHLIQEDPGLLRKVTEVKEKSRNSLVHSRIKKVLNFFPS